MRGAVIAVVVASCAARPEIDRSLRIEFVADAPVGGEAYRCTTISASAFRAIERIELLDPPRADVILHHATLYAVSRGNAFAEDRCATMPDDATPLYVWAPGAAPWSLDTPLAVPAGTTALVVQAHAARRAVGPAAKVALRLVMSDRGDAAWRSISAPVPAIRPRRREVMTWSCAAASAARIQYVWPHMHRIGRRIVVARRRGGERLPIVDVSWSFAEQAIYARPVGLDSGDRVEVQCEWENPGDEYVLPGLLADNEMCNVGMVMTPAAASWSDCR